MYRTLSTQLTKPTPKVTVLLGARQVGKTTLLKNTFSNATFINLEKSDYIEIFNQRDLPKIQNIIQQEGQGHSRLLILDEVQRLQDPSLIAKLIHDELPDVSLIISGSSALEIADRASESLAGRKRTLRLFPLTLKEKLIQQALLPQQEKFQMNFQLNDSSLFTPQIKESMRYGLYPETLNTTELENYLFELVESAVLKDVFFLNLIKNTKQLISLLKLLAYQIGRQINITDLADRVGVTRPTVANYLEILKKIYIIYTLPPYRKNRRDEIGKTEKVYFYDLGIRNALVEDFSPVEYRVDYGNLFENFVINEILKLNSYYNERFGMYYWRTKWGSEVDLVLYKDGKIKALEIKTNQGHVTSAFKTTYPAAEEYVITLDNVESLLLG